jgi:hypothetical protein
MMEPIGCPETPVRRYRYLLRGSRNSVCCKPNPNSNLTCTYGATFPNVSSFVLISIH